jgi:glycosyltransferase involved in cell wall biosynthesis
LVVTLTDFWFLCPQVTLRRSDGVLCDGHTTAWECLRCLLGASHLYQRAAHRLPAAVLAPAFTFASQHPALSRRRGLRGLALDMAARKARLLPLLEQAATIISPSHFLAEQYRANGLRRPIQVVPHGHDLRWTAAVQLRPAAGPLVFGYVGRLTEAKGVHVLVEAAAQLAPDLPVEIHIYGDLTAEPDYVARLRALAGASPRVQFKGPFGKAALAQVYNSLDVVVVPSIWYENSPLVIHEAYAAGRPVIASDLGGMAEFTVHGLTGLTFVAGDAAALAQAMTRLATEPGLLNHLRAHLPPVRTIADERQALNTIYAAAVAAPHA